MSSAPGAARRLVAFRNLDAVSAHPKPRTYEVRTYGCQMNAHDSERIAGLLEEAGYVAADGRRSPT